MIEKDTVRLLRECDAGVQMGISAIDDVMGHTHAPELMERLDRCKQEHAYLQERIRTNLDRYSDTGKKPNPMAKGMSWIKTNARLAVSDTDETVADLISAGCSMGVRSLSRYLNQYQAADEVSKGITKDLIRIEDQLEKDIRGFL